MRYFQTSLWLMLLVSSQLFADLKITWKAPEQTNHPLAGWVWDTRQSSNLLNLSEWLDQIDKGTWLLIGEQHDHPDHHQLQTLIIQTLANDNRLGSVAFEMANTDQQSFLDDFLGKGDDVTADDLKWSPGWPWERYENQLRDALNHATRVVAADLPRSAQMLAYQQGAAEGQLDDAHTRYMMELIFTSHCEMLPRANLPQMLQVQLGRDQQMARAMIENTQPDKVNLLIAGSIHVRNDLGIPRWLNIPLTSLVLMPLDASHEPTDYLDEVYPNFPSGELSSDFLLFTPTMPEQDYCAAFQ
ncbi:MAG: ChaN family lipoprotein [Nitrincola sp.]|nr:ChaN family lipoprotein [Nitrincola sp.]